MSDTPDVDPTRVPAPLGPSREQRDRVVEQLQQAFGDGVMTVEQLDERLDLAERARNIPELRVLTRDLPAVVGEPAAGPTALATVTPAAPAVVQPSGTTSVVAIFGGAERRGVWTPPAKVLGLALFGGVEIDVRKAELAPGSVTRIECLAAFGGLEVIVPPTVNVITKGIGIFGGFGGKDCQVDPAAPTIEVTGAALFGGVDVKVKKAPGDG